MESMNIGDAEESAVLWRVDCLCSGYLRKNYAFDEKKIRIINFVSIISKYLLISWKFDYMFSYRNNTCHGISNNKKTVQCNAHSKCPCFFRCNKPMYPNTGVYKLKLKIKKAGKNSIYIGITCNKNDINPTLVKDKIWYESNDYIAWMSYAPDELDLMSSLIKYWPHGLICGERQNQSTNIFYSGKPFKFKYKSRNNNYKDRLPGYGVGDIIIVEYDSYKFELSFKKQSVWNISDEKEKELDSYIYNLPNNREMYWFVGHNWYSMCVTTLDCW